jgi:hypothetical protein
MKMVNRALLYHLLEITQVGLVVLVGVIGGSGLYHLDNLTFVCVSAQPPDCVPE